ncbi:hypothetical protein HBI95_131290 [Parastagonospora nodorum]|nr:hypothetical protein HBI95_131290 [Parastagonospora nodorum]
MSGASLDRYRVVLASFIWAATRLVGGSDISNMLNMARGLELDNGRFFDCYVTWLSTVQRSACGDTRALFKNAQSGDVDTVWTVLQQTWALAKASKRVPLQAFEYLSS